MEHVFVKVAWFKVTHYFNVSGFMFQHSHFFPFPNHCDVFPLASFGDWPGGLEAQYLRPCHLGVNVWIEKGEERPLNAEQIQDGKQ